MSALQTSILLTDALNINYQLEHWLVVITWGFKKTCPYLM